MTRLRNFGWRAGLCGLLSLGIISCRTTHKGDANPVSKKEALQPAVGPAQTGSFLPRHVYVSEETKLEDERRDREKKERKAKSKSAEKAKKSDKRKPVDEDYIPRAGFR